MTDPLKEIISQAEKIIKENNNVYQFTKVSQTATSYSITATNTAGQNKSFLTDRNMHTAFDWESNFYGRGWSNVIVSRSLLEGPLSLSNIPNATTTAGDAAYSQRAVSTSTSGLPVSLIPSLGRPTFVVPGLGGTVYTPASHTPTAPYGINEVDNQIQQYFMGMSNDDKFEMGWEGGDFVDWWDDRAARASAPTSGRTSPGGSVVSPEITSAFNQKIPSVNDAMYHEFLDLIDKKMQSGTGTTGVTLPDERLIRQYEGITGNPVSNLFSLGKMRTLDFTDYDVEIMNAALRRLTEALQLPQDYRTLREADEAEELRSRQRAERHLNILNDIISPAANIAKGLENSVSDSGSMRKFI